MWLSVSFLIPLCCVGCLLCRHIFATEELSDTDCGSVVALLNDPLWPEVTEVHGGLWKWESGWPVPAYVPWPGGVPACGWSMACRRSLRLTLEEASPEESMELWGCNKTAFQRFLQCHVIPWNHKSMELLYKPMDSSVVYRLQIWSI
jgi:hypothetical protein